MSLRERRAENAVGLLLGIPNTKAEYTKSVSFPLVIDAPKQQGQDKVHPGAGRCRLPRTRQITVVRVP